MIRKIVISAIAGAIMSLPAHAADLMHKLSPHSVTVTIDRLAAAVEGAGATVFARIDHAAGATDVDLVMRPTEVLIFGNPKFGAPAMLDAQTAGLDLPLRVLAYADAEGVVHVTYHAPAALLAPHGLQADAPYVQTMTAAMDKLTSKAIAQD